MWRLRTSGDILAVADWSQKLSFYQLNGKQAFKDRRLAFDATQISWHCNGDFLLAAGSNKQCAIYTSEGIKLSTVAEKKSWVLCIKHKPNSNYIVSHTLTSGQGGSEIRSLISVATEN